MSAPVEGGPSFVQEIMAFRLACKKRGLDVSGIVFEPGRSSAMAERELLPYAAPSGVSFVRGGARLGPPGATPGRVLKEHDLWWIGSVASVDVWGTHAIVDDRRQVARRVG